MKKLDQSEALLLRSMLLDRLRGLPNNLQGAVASAFDSAVSHYNAEAKVPRLARKCNKCGTRTIRGVYRDGTRRWYCRECAKIMEIDQTQTEAK